jgi:predicted S18 family serine protease
MKLKILLLLFLFSSCIFSCNGSASILVPAVVGDGSSLVNISARLIPGNSDVFLSTFPQTGTSTQASVDDAALYAFSKAKVGNCDAVILIDTSGSAGYVDGPSGGAAVTVLTYSAAKGIPIRSDTVMTGSVDIMGNVGQVGGLYEKAMAASANSADYFLVPKGSFLDLILLKSVQKNRGIEIFEITNVDQAIDFMVYNKSLSPLSFDQPKSKIPILPKYDTSGMRGFENVSEGMIKLNNKTVVNLPEKDNDSITIKSHFKSQVEIQSELLKNGYYFSAANEAFLDYIEASTINAVLTDEVKLSEKKKSVGRCLTELPVISKTDENFEWVVGSDLRRSWATTKLSTTNISDAKLIEEKVIAYNELMHSDAWCFVSGSLATAANQSGREIDEKSWMNLSKDMIDNADLLNITSPSSRAKLDNAKYSYDQGKYGAALFDAVFVISMEGADQDLNSLNVSELNHRIEQLLGENRTSLWGNVYQSQGAYLANTSSSLSAYRLLTYAKAIDETTDSMRSAIVKQERGFELTSSDITTLYLSMFLIITMLLFYIAVKLSRRSNGKHTNPKRRRNIH